MTSSGTPAPVPGSSSASAEGAGAAAVIRRMLLALVMFGTAGLLLELLLLEHFETAAQLVPVTLLAAALVAGAALAVHPTRGVVRAFQAVMAAFLAAAAAGLYLHYRGNVEFELEMDAAAEGVALVWAALRGATPTLAPGALAQLGLLGLILTFRHPCLSADSDASGRPARPREIRDER